MRRVLVSECNAKAVNIKLAMMPTELRRSNQFVASQFTMSLILTRGRAPRLEPVGDIAFGINQQLAWQANNALIRPATGRRGQQRHTTFRDVDANHGKVAIFELPNVRAALTGSSLRTVGVRVWTNALFESHTPLYLTIAK